jgi:hypothetical protein
MVVSMVVWERAAVAVAVGRFGFATAAVADNTTTRKNSVNRGITEGVLLIPDFKTP